MRTYDLSPLWRSSIGFDRISTLLDAALRGDENTPSYPPYNVEKLNDDQYRIVLAVAGFKREDVTITVKDQTLTIAAKLAESAADAGVTTLYKGIASRAFERKFSLADHVKVVSANMDNGLLYVELQREVPESSKPRMIEIGTGANNNAPRIDQKKAN